MSEKYNVEAKCGSNTLNVLSEYEDKIYAECYVCGQKITIEKSHYSKRELRKLLLPAQPPNKAREV